MAKGKVRKATGTKAKSSKKKPPARALATKANKLPAQTKAELALVVDEVVDSLNITSEKVEVELEGAANLLLRRLFGNQSTMALDPDKRANPLYKAVRARAGHSLKFDRDELRQLVIIGALNQRLTASTGWGPLDWSVKLELLSLVNAKDERLPELHRGIVFAAKTGTSLREVQAWKRAEFPQLPGTRGRPRGFTLAAGRSFVNTGVRLGSEHERKAFAGHVRDAPEPTRRALVRDLEKTIENLRKLREEIGEE